MKMVDGLLPENLVQTQSLNLHQFPSLRDQKTHLQECSMVVIRDAQHHNDCSVFPPINHENLHISSHSYQHLNIPESPSSTSSSSSVYSFSPSDTDTWVLSSSPPSDSELRKTGEFSGWMSIGLEILRSKVFAVVTPFRNCAANRAAIWSIGPAAAAVVMSWWMCMQFWRWLRRGRRQTQGENHLMAIIKEKDEKIAQLLQKIAQMNEILIAHHKALAAKLTN